MKKLFLIYLFIITVNINAQTFLDITYISGSPNSTDLNLIQKITFSETDIVFLLNDDSTVPKTLSNISKITFSSTEGGTSLPVEFTSFETLINKNKVTLIWQTATEINNYGFQVERQKAKGESEWEVVGFVEGHGNSNSPKDYTFTDDLLGLSLNLNLNYRLKQLDFDGNYEYSDVVEVTLAENIKEYKLEQNFPNPFNPSTEIKFSIPQNSNVKLELFNMIGEKVATLINEEMAAGSHNYQLSISNYQLSSGIYLYRIQSGNFVQTRKLMLLK